MTVFDFFKPLDVFGITDAAEDVSDSVIEIATSLADGELPRQKTVKTLVAAGLDVAAIAAMFEVSEDFIRESLGEE